MKTEGSGSISRRHPDPHQKWHGSATLVSSSLSAHVEGFHWGAESRFELGGGAPYQSWAHLDQAPNDLYTTLFRNLSPTPFTQILEVLSKQAHFFGAALETIDAKVSIIC
jgi:hypothetical protein